MSQPNLPPNLGTPPELPIAPENDSSEESIGFGSMLPTAKALSSVIPELTIGSPQPMPQETQPAAPVAAVPLPRPSEPIQEHWETVVVNPPAQTAVPAPPPPPPPPVPIAPTIIEKLAAPPMVLNYPAPSPIQAPTAPVELEQPPSQMGGEVLEEEEVRPKIVRFSSYGFMAMGGLYALGALSLTGLGAMITTGIRGQTNNPVPAEFIYYYPITAWLPILLALAAGIFIIVGTFIGQGTRKAWWWGVIAVFGLPLIIVATGGWSIKPIVQVLNQPQLIRNQEILNNIQADFLTNSLNAALLPIILGLMLLVGLKAWHYPAVAIGTITKGMLAGLIVLLVGGVIGLYAYLYFLSSDGDYGYSQVRQAVSFKVYRPVQLPEGWSYATRLFLNTAKGSLLVGRDDFVEVSFDHSLPLRLQGMPSAAVTLREIDVPSGFDMTTFAQTVIDTPNRVEEIAVTRAQGQKGFSIEKNNPTGTIRVLTLMTGDNVLLLLSSKTASIEEMVRLANSLD